MKSPASAYTPPQFLYSTLSNTRYEDHTTPSCFQRVKSAMCTSFLSLERFCICCFGTSLVLVVSGIITATTSYSADDSCTRSCLAGEITSIIGIVGCVSICSAWIMYSEDHTPLMDQLRDWYRAIEGQRETS